MDRIELKKHKRKGGLADETTSSPKNLLNKIKTTFGNATLTIDGVSKRPTEFYEFFINDRPLSTILTEFCNLDNSLLDNWVGVLGAFSNRQSERITIKRLLLKQITEQDIKDLFPKDLDQYFLDIGNYKQELSDEEIIIYGCAECGNYDCGGYKIKVDKEEDTVVWTYNDEERTLQFHFNKHQYFNTFDAYSQTIKNEKNYR